MKKSLPFIILAVGSLQILGHLTDSRLLRGLGLVSGISPYPKVFCEVDGYEPFAARFDYVGENDRGVTQTYPITAERYAQLSGPYNRRNAYGAGLAYAPRLPDDLRAYFFSNIDPILTELTLPELKNSRIKITPKIGEEVTLYEYPLP